MTWAEYRRRRKQYRMERALLTLPDRYQAPEPWVYDEAELFIASSFNLFYKRMK
jgi:hypothetical protein